MNEEQRKTAENLIKPIVDKMSPEELQNLQKLGKRILKNPHQFSKKHTDKMFKELGLDINKIATTERKKIIKQGRNEQCNCHSGKKYKKCCGI